MAYVKNMVIIFIISAVSLIFILLFGLTYYNNNFIKNDSLQDITELKSANLQIDNLNMMSNSLIYGDKQKQLNLDSLNLIKSLLANEVAKRNLLITGLEKNIQSQSLVDHGTFFISTIKTLLGIIVSIPFILIIIIFAIISNKLKPSTISSWFRNVKNIEAFGTKIELSPQNKADLEDTIKEYQSIVKFQYDLWQQRQNIRTKFEKVVKKLKADIATSGKDVNNLRATLHVPDLLFKNRLYQLVDYWPGGSGRGRTYSARFGIIGRSWRLQENIITNVPTDATELIKSWSMTQEEAERRTKQCFATIILENEQNTPLGILYLDSETPSLFGNSQDEINEFCSRASEESKKNGLISALDNRSELLSQSLLLDFQ